jgi:hypothetical protein
MIATWHPSRSPLEVSPRNGNFVRILGQCAPALLSCKDSNGLRDRSVGIRRILVTGMCPGDSIRRLLIYFWNCLEHCKSLNRSFNQLWKLVSGSWTCLVGIEATTCAQAYRIGNDWHRADTKIYVVRPGCPHLYENLCRCKLATLK